VLSGGGPIGIGWHAGMVAAFADAGIDVTGADRFVGTSAGAVIGSMLARGKKPFDEIKRAVDVDPDSSYTANVGQNLQRLVEIMTRTAESTPAQRLEELGRLSVEAETVPEETFLDRFAYLSGEGWPPNFVCTAIDVEDGSFHAWSESSGVDPIRAIASSCSVPGFFPPITIDGHRYMDGGMRSLTNADLAAGCDRVLILTLFAPPPDATDPRALRFRGIFEREQQEIEEAGGSSLLLSPDAEAQSVMGVNLMDPTKTAEASEAGYAQGKRAADTVAAFWSAE
jgi:NTE family protein